MKDDDLSSILMQQIWQKLVGQYVNALLTALTLSIGEICLNSLGSMLKYRNLSAVC